ncbi:MAG: YigZ family protein [Flavobacteriales bacterium]|nr:YigZ family protein [Flavobacteriales bacterium]
MSDAFTYRTIENGNEIQFTVSGSRFIAFAEPLQNEDEARNFLNLLKVRYPDASHRCYAWVLGFDRQNERMNDDGEPNFTAGKPILKYIRKFELTNVMVVVVRYFGGKKLGVPGLIRAYGDASKLCLQDQKIAERRIKEKIILEVDPIREFEVYNLLNGIENEILDRRISKNIRMVISVPKECFISLLDLFENKPFIKMLEM